MDSKKGRILIADDDSGLRAMVRQVLEYDGFEVVEAEDGPHALKELRKGICEVLLLDVKMPGMDGFEVMSAMQSEGLDVPVVVISAHEAVSNAVEAIRRGAYDFLEKPFKREALKVRVQKAQEHTRLKRANRELAESSARSGEIIGDGPSIRHVKELLEKVAPTPARVLITGENGTGKELLARAIHMRSSRASGPFVELNCAAIPGDLIESELFGHERGAFTGAERRRLGKFERADRGTIFLDEIGDMSQAAQAKVLRALETSTFERVGGQDLIHVDVRVISATNRELQNESSGFREDLFYRLNVIQIHLPPLRERPEDIEGLFLHFLRTAALEMGQRVKGVDDGVLEILKRQPWRGNIRELRNLAERLAIVAPDEKIHEADLSVLAGSEATKGEHEDVFASSTFNEFKAASEALFLQGKLREFSYNVSRTAEELQMQRSNLYKKIQRYDLRTSS
jgi:DNA-binding NtrC family response regulator